MDHSQLDKRARPAQRQRGLLPLLLFSLASACSETPPDYFQGYLEVEYLHLAAAQSGRVEKLGVDRGQEVSKDQLLVALDAERERAALDEARSRLTQAQSLLLDLGSGKRPAERAVIQAQLEQARTAAALSQKEAQRRQSLVERKLLAIELAEEAASLSRRDAQRVTELQAQLRVADLPARQAQIEAAQSEVQAAEALVAQAQWSLQQREVRSPAAGWVHDVYYRAGEWVPAGRPALAITPIDRFEVRFFVDTGTAAGLRSGDPVAISGAGMVSSLDGRVSFVADQPEYAPPLIFSRDHNDKLLFQVRALLHNQDQDGTLLRLNPGLPVEVRLQ